MAQEVLSVGAGTPTSFRQHRKVHCSSPDHGVPISLRRNARRERAHASDGECEIWLSVYVAIWFTLFDALVCVCVHVCICSKV